MAQNGSFASALPTFALYAFVGYRLMPALQQIYGTVTQLRFAGSAIDALHKDLMSLQPANPHQAKAAMPLTQVITLNQIQYIYPNAPQPAPKHLSLTIPARSTGSLVGETDSDKTTTVDLILGLLKAPEGTLEVVGQAISEYNRRSWKRAIGYVPQQIYLADDAVAANIAFGIQAEDVHQSVLQRTAKIANLHDFVISELPEQYQTTMGERGVRFSRGQRQCIGIARALYHNRQVLILDEATSALDDLTEQAVMGAKHNFGHDVTVILIAHRLSIVKACDVILLLEESEMKARGRFKDLTQSSERFRAMLASDA